MLGSKVGQNSISAAVLRVSSTALCCASGDRVTIRYVDDRYVTKGKQKHERFLNVAFSDGRIEFADIEPRFSPRHRKKMPYYERLLRFQHFKPFPVVIRDADMAAEITELTKNQILAQAGISVLAQANAASQSVLGLLQ